MELLSCPFEEDKDLLDILGEEQHHHQQQEDPVATATSPTMHFFDLYINNSMVDQTISENFGNSSYHDHSSGMGHQQMLFPSHQQPLTQYHHQGSQSPMEIQHENYLDENLLFSGAFKSHQQHNSSIYTNTSPFLSYVMSLETKSASMLSIDSVSNNDSSMVTEDSEQEQSSTASSPNINETENLPSDFDDEGSGDYYEGNNGAGPRFYCSRCPAGQKGYQRLRELLSRHIRPFHYDVRFRCKTCGKKYTRSDSLTLHKNRKQH
ncbi:hypothetical protein BDC45DRAFT_522067 [Circinella umbellata]|nr:hypothetical protein BDC45DRAFT_522067 [Circinella umbellata]